MSHPLFTLVFLTLVLVATAARPNPTTPRLPSPLVIDYQLGGAYPPPAGVTALVRDHTSHPEPGYFNICHFDGYQIPARASWPADLLLHAPDGTPLTDPEWPHDYLLDISTGEARARNLLLVLPMLLTCIHKGFSAIEFDNIDSYRHSLGKLTLKDSGTYGKLLTGVAHGNGLAAGQKNTAEFGRYGRDKVGFDFAIVEGCYLWHTCDAFTRTYGLNVIAIEFADDLRGTLAEVCADPDRPATLLVRDRMFTPAGHIDHVYQHCPVPAHDPSN